MSAGRRQLSSDQFWLLLGAAVLLSALLTAALWVFALHGRAASRLAELEPRHARLAGLLGHGEQIAAAEQAVQASLAQHLYPADADAGQVGNGVLQRVREIAAQQDLRVTSSQVTAPSQDKDHPQLERIGLSLRVEGDWPKLQALFTALASQRPVVYGQTLQLLPQAVLAGRAQAIQVQLDLFVLKERRP